MTLLKRISAALGLMAASAALPAIAQDAIPSTNQQTADAIAASLRSHAELTRSRISIETREGTVFLAGTVASPALKVEAVRRAGQTPGVVSVVDRLRVTGDSRVRTVQFQPAGPAMGGQPTDLAMGGGLFHHNNGAMPADGGMMMNPSASGMTNGAPAGANPTQAPAYDGPLPEGAAGMSAPGATAGQPNYAWPSYAPPGNFSAVGYPTAYPWQAFPNIGPFYPYPEVPLDWRAVTLRWDDGIWWLDFRKHYTRPFFTPYPFGLFAY